MNLKFNKNREKSEVRQNGELEKSDDDNSDEWSLPDWPELSRDRIRIARKKRRAARKKAKRLRELALAKEDQASAFGSTSNLTIHDEGEDIPEDMKSRGRWGNSWEFLLSIISMSVGMGNFYRFPFVAYKNGGGAFLIPYMCVLTVVGRPMYFLELAVGQFCSYGQVKVWEMSPFFMGVGYGSALASFFVVTYYSSVMGVTLYYLFNSFKMKLPWTVCDPEWAGKDTCQKISNITAHNKSVTPKMVANLPQLYFENKVMQEKDGIEDGLGGLQGIPVLCLFISWVLIYLLISRGVQSTGKSSYFTTFYPYIIIIVLLITACTQDGATDGMLYFITPDWTKVMDPSVWFAAVGQCFFSLSTGFGPIINYASYNPFRHPIYRDAMIVSLMDTLASLLAGLTVFATLGNIAHVLNKPLNHVISSSPGLVFISFSDAISDFAYVPQLLSVLFFSMLMTLAVGSAVASQMATISVICDQFPRLSRTWVTIVTSLLGFIGSLLYATPGGQFMLTLVDNYGGNVNIYILATLECIGIAWVYGLNNFTRDVEFMLNIKIGCFWRLCWGFVIPVMLTIVMVYSLATAERLQHNGHDFPDIAIGFGWMLTVLSLATFPIGAIYAMCKASGNLKERFLEALKPTKKFGPRNPRDRERWEIFKKGTASTNGDGDGPPETDTDLYKLHEGEAKTNHYLPPDSLTLRLDMEPWIGEEVESVQEKFEYRFQYEPRPRKLDYS